MKLKLIVALAAVISLQPAWGNTKLADLMQGISDQTGELGALSKLAPAEVDPKVWKKAQSRCRLVTYLFGIIDERKGTVDAAGALVPGELTPETFTKLGGQELTDFVAKFSTTVGEVSAIFGKIESELAAQESQDPATRDFTQFKSLMGQLGSAIRAAHKVFNP